MEKKRKATQRWQNIEGRGPVLQITVRFRAELSGEREVLSFQTLLFSTEAVLVSFTGFTGDSKHFAFWELASLCFT